MAVFLSKCDSFSLLLIVLLGINSVFSIDDLHFYQTSPLPQHEEIFPSEFKLLDNEIIKRPHKRDIPIEKAPSTHINDPPPVSVAITTTTVPTSTQVSDYISTDVFHYNNIEVIASSSSRSCHVDNYVTNVIVG